MKEQRRRYGLAMIYACGTKLMLSVADSVFLEDNVSSRNTHLFLRTFFFFSLQQLKACLILR